MQYKALLGLAGLALPSVAFAAQCKAIHFDNTNTILEPPKGRRGVEKRQGTTTNGIRVYGADGSQIGSYIPGEFDDPICQHTIGIANNPPYGIYNGHTVCDTLTIDSCSGSYAGENDIPGAVNNGDDFYGIGEDVNSECQVLFDC